LASYLVLSDELEGPLEIPGVAPSGSVHSTSDQKTQSPIGVDVGLPASYLQKHPEDAEVIHVVTRDENKGPSACRQWAPI
jgi:hypothetical protein